MGSNIEPIPRTLKPAPENTAPQRTIFRGSGSTFPYLLTRLYLSSAYELAKDPSLSFPAMEAESMVMSGFRFKERCQASAESEYSTCPTRLFLPLFLSYLKRLCFIPFPSFAASPSRIVREEHVDRGRVKGNTSFFYDYELKSIIFWFREHIYELS